MEHFPLMVSVLSASVHVNAADSFPLPHEAAANSSAAAAVIKLFVLLIVQY
jgi:hypothetical protein